MKRWTDGWTLNAEGDMLEKTATQYVGRLNVLEIPYQNENDSEWYTYICAPLYVSIYRKWYEQGKLVPGCLHEIEMVKPLKKKKNSIVWISAKVIEQREIL